VILLPIGGILILVDQLRYLGSEIARLGGCLDLVCAFKNGFQHPLDSLGVVIGKLLDGYERLRHLPLIVVSVGNRDHARFALERFHVARCPGYQRLSGDGLLFAGLLAALYHRAFFAVTGNIFLDAVRDILGVDPVQRLGVIGFFIGVVLDAVVGRPFHGDVPVAVADNADNHATFGLVGGITPLLWPHELVLTTRVTGRTNNYGPVFLAKAGEFLVQRRKEGGRGAIAHN